MQKYQLRQWLVPYLPLLGRRRNHTWSLGAVFMSLISFHSVTQWRSWRATERGSLEVRRGMKYGSWPPGVHKITGDTKQKGKRLTEVVCDKDYRNGALCLTAAFPQTDPARCTCIIWEFSEIHILELYPRTIESDAQLLGPGISTSNEIITQSVYTLKF